MKYNSTRWIAIGIAVALVIGGLVAIIVNLYLGAAIASFSMGVVVLHLMRVGEKGESNPLIPAVLLIAGVALVFIGLKEMDVIGNGRNRQYTKELGGTEYVLGLSGSAEVGAGTKYVIYDEEEDEFLADILPEEYAAKSVDEIAGIFHLSKDSERVGSYANGDDARVRVYTLELKDFATGELIAVKSVRGSNPPDQIRSRSGSSHQSHYGSAPGSEEIATVCVRMIEERQE